VFFNEIIEKIINLNLERLIGQTIDISKDKEMLLLKEIKEDGINAICNFVLEAKKML
jgi:hypothetical protein